jgi:hypothetical protein
MKDDGSIGGMLGVRNWSTPRKQATVPLCPSQFPRDLARARILVAAVGSQRLTVCATARQIQGFFFAFFVFSACFMIVPSLGSGNRSCIFPRNICWRHKSARHYIWEDATVLDTNTKSRVVSHVQRGGSPTVINLSFLDRISYLAFK